MSQDEPVSTSRGARHALIIANDTYDHASLSQLRAPEADARALADVLGDPDIGGFEVTVVHNEASYEVQAHIDDLFTDSRPDDLLLLHFSGHGLKSDSGELFFAARNTRPDRLGSTSVTAEFVQRCMRTARARTIVLFLDCCYGGAFGEGVAVRAAGPVNVVDSFPAGRLGGGRGRAVITASSAMEYAFEGTTLTADHQPQPSVFTSALVEGLRSGEADRDEDGLVALGELYDYVFDRVREQNPRQTPGRDVEMSGEVYLARSRRRRIRAVPISDALTAALGNPDPTYRRGAVLELRDRLGHPDLGVALGALEALQQVVRSDTKAVADDAAAVIAAAAPAVTPAELDFGELATDADVAVERELVVTGVPLAREVTVEAEPPLSTVVDGDRVTVSFSPTGRAYAGSMRVVAPTGAVVVPARALVASRWAVGTETGPTGPASTAVADPAATGAEPVAARAEPVTAGAEPVTAAEPVEAAAGSLHVEAGTEAHEPSAPRLAQRRLSPVQPLETPDDEPNAPHTKEIEPEPTGQPTAAAARPTAPAHAAYADDGGTAEERGLGRWPAWAYFIGAALLVLAGAIRFHQGGYQDFVAATIGALLAVATGILILTPRVRVDVTVWTLVSVTVAVGVNLAATMLGDSSNVGGQKVWWSFFVALSLMGLTGLVVITAAASRSSLRRGPIVWRDPVTICVLVAAAALTVLLARYGQALIAGERETSRIVETFLSAAGTLALALAALAARPAAAGRLMILAWCIAMVGFTLGDSDVQAPLVAVTVVLGLTGSFIGRRVVSDSSTA